MSEKDIPVMFRWETPWRPNEIEELQANLGLRSGRTRDINTVMGFVLGQAIKTYRADPERWISYSRNPQGILHARLPFQLLSQAVHRLRERQARWLNCPTHSLPATQM